MVPLKRSVVDESIFEMTETNEDVEVAPGACTLIHVRALNPGHTQVRVVLDQVKPPVEAVVTIAAYKELVVSGWGSFFTNVCLIYIFPVECF